MTETDTIQSAQDEQSKSKWQLFKSEWGGFIVLLFCLFCFRSVIADWNAVPTGSMKPTIYEGDRIWVNKLSYGLRIPFTNIRIKDLVSRVVAKLWYSQSHAAVSVILNE